MERRAADILGQGCSRWSCQAGRKVSTEKINGYNEGRRAGGWCDGGGCWAKSEMEAGDMLRRPPKGRSWKKMRTVLQKKQQHQQGLRICLLGLHSLLKRTSQMMLISKLISFCPQKSLFMASSVRPLCRQKYWTTYIYRTEGHEAPGAQFLVLMLMPEEVWNCAESAEHFNLPL